MLKIKVWSFLTAVVQNDIHKQLAENVPLSWPLRYSEMGKKTKNPRAGSFAGVNQHNSIEVHGVRETYVHLESGSQTLRATILLLTNIEQSHDDILIIPLWISGE